MSRLDNTYLSETNDESTITLEDSSDHDVTSEDANEHSQDIGDGRNNAKENALDTTLGITKNCRTWVLHHRITFRAQKSDAKILQRSICYDSRDVNALRIMHALAYHRIKYIFLHVGIIDCIYVTTALVLYRKKSLKIVPKTRKMSITQQWIYWRRRWRVWHLN